MASIFQKPWEAVASPVLFEPAVVRGKHAASNEDFMALVEKHFVQNLRNYRDDPGAAIAKAKHISCTTMGIEQRYFCRQIEDLNIPLTPQEQASEYIHHGMEMALPAIEEALGSAGVSASQIGCIVFVSHSPFPFPPFTAHLMSKMAFKTDCVQIPVNSMGCAGGGFALRAARDYLLAHPEENVLVLSVELCSLGFRPYSKDMSWFLNSALFGDAVAAAVVRGGLSFNDLPAQGLAIVRGKQRLVPHTTHVSYFKYSEWGYDFVTTQELCATVREHAPHFASELCGGAFGGKQPKDIALTVVHPGGAKMIQDAHAALCTLGTWSHEAALESMADGGNRASATIIDMLRSAWGRLKAGDEVIAMGMGPGFVMDGVAMRAVTPPLCVVT
mmetsp:Transcript_101166/g.286697  ORF Transcript_101166/g.286697 Transcript_101166/m.286697 type:complete len:387 (-) Transcript_101166:124-1284(-)|eukprot:CAMPEP_0168360662 /NCGR_PEP_ID=MMETSP0228-20121227/2275_1 /TAXON_ID=133427 /ORGANISM="Protoceratium reticulatum, Strain CCCM 535 (=CCMP 1889)" /LENGTH=386 /DNA_ID=CAMNT_0008373333 /DNA_START=84 /DNA_END=1244 /DNA_ORIENTATION=-